MNNLYYVIGTGLLAMLFAFWKTNWINRQDEGSDRMKQIGTSIADGALAFLNFKDVRKEVDFDFGGDTVIETIFTTWDGLVVQVSTIEADGQHWAKFDAKFDEALAEPVDPPIRTNTSDDNAEEEIEDPHKAIREEVKAISVRAIGWAYLLDQNKLSQLRRGSESFIELDVPDEEEDAGEVVPDQ